MDTLYQAARTCGRDDTQPRTMEVHVTPKSVEACDNFRLYRSEGVTRFKKEALIPASSLEAVSKHTFSKFSQFPSEAKNSWVHFKTKTGHVVSIRCSIGKYPNLDPVLILKKPQRIIFPENLGEVLKRAEVMQETSWDSTVGVSLAKGEIKLTSRKDSGWYEETSKAKYSGKPISFHCNPKFLDEVLSKTRKVLVGCGASSGYSRLKLTTDNATFAVSLEVEDKKDE
jgi:DNA polymerase III sliding clamp (beta) subunit (PCNA family)